MPTRVKRRPRATQRRAYPRRRIRQALCGLRDCRAGPGAKRLNVTLSGIDAVGAQSAARLPHLRRRHRLCDGARRRRRRACSRDGGKWPRLARAARLCGGSASSYTAAGPGACAPSTRASSNGVTCAVSSSICRASTTCASRRNRPARRTLTLRFPGGADELASALARRGLALENGPTGSLRSATGATRSRAASERSRLINGSRRSTRRNNES